MYRILIPEDIAESGKRYLTDRGYELKVGVPTDIPSLKKEIARADGIIVRNASYPKEVFEGAERLKVIARHGIGVDNIDVAAANAQGIWVVNGPGSNSNAVAEHTVAEGRGAGPDRVREHRTAGGGEGGSRVRDGGAGL